MQAVRQEFDQAPGGQLSQIAPDPRPMKTRGAGAAGCSGQARVGARHRLIVDHEATSVPCTLVKGA